MSSAQNIAVSYLFTQPGRLIEPLTKKCLNIRPLRREEEKEEEEEEDQKTEGNGAVRLKAYRRFGLEDCHIVHCIGIGGFSRVYLI